MPDPELDQMDDQQERRYRREANPVDGGKALTAAPSDLSPLHSFVGQLQQQAGNAAVADWLTTDASAVEKVVRGSGQPLDSGVGAKVGRTLGQDFSGVRVHTDSEAAESAAGLEAAAYTVGDDIVFGVGNYQPGTDAGRRMLAHELTHVAQQRSGPVSGDPTPGGLVVSDPHSQEERHADQVAHGSAPVTGMPSATSARAESRLVVQRTPAPLSRDAVAMTFPTPLDADPLIRYCEEASDSMWGVFTDTNMFEDSGLEAEIRQIVGSGYFSQRGTSSWTSPNVKTDGGFLAPYLHTQVIIELFEDGITTSEAGSTATVGSQSGVISATGRSDSTTNTNSLSVTGGASNAPPSGQGGTTASGSATASGSSSTTLGTSGSTSVGGSASGQVASQTAIYNSTVYARVTLLQYRSDAVFGDINRHRNQSGFLQIGTARYSRPTLAAAATP